MSFSGAGDSPGAALVVGGAYVGGRCAVRVRLHSVDEFGVEIAQLWVVANHEIPIEAVGEVRVTQIGAAPPHGNPRTHK